MGAAKVNDFGTGATEVKPSVNRAVVRAKKAAEKKESAKKRAVKKQADATKKANEKRIAAEKKQAARVVSAAAKGAKKTPSGSKKKYLHVVLEYEGASFNYRSIVDRAKKVWKEQYHGKPSELLSLELYIKPEDQRVYYVMNGEAAGDFLLRDLAD